MRRSVLPSFRRIFDYSDLTFSAHSVARLIVGRHFVTLCICSEQCARCTLLTTPMTCTSCDHNCKVRSAEHLLGVIACISVAQATTKGVTIAM